MNFIRLTSTAELGSLEDLQPQKRMTVADIRSLRRQAHKQTQIQFSVRRSIATAIAYVREQINKYLAERKIETISRVPASSLPSAERKFTRV
ncbi:MAG TPA: hypothetical protein V6C76_17695 [Drouetiella sp.]